MQPNTRKSKMRKRTRRSHHALQPTSLIGCPQCNQAKLPHAACGNCGYVNAHTSIKIATSEES